MRRSRRSAARSRHRFRSTRRSRISRKSRPGVPTYPPLVWQWLQGEPRRALIAQWQRLGRLGGEDKAAWLSRPVEAAQDADVGDLQDRNRMLADVRARVALLKRGLADAVARGMR